MAGLLGSPAREARWRRGCSSATVQVTATDAASGFVKDVRFAYCEEGRTPTFGPRNIATATVPTTGSTYTVTWTIPTCAAQPVPSSPSAL